jgi:phage shock protein A
MLENGNTSDYTKQSVANDLDSLHSDIKQAVDKSEKVNISLNEKEEQVEHFLTDTNCLKERKNNNNYSKRFKCDKCDKRYTWYSGLSNHKRFVHNKLKET